MGPYLAGFLASIALGMQQTVLADVFAICVVLLMTCPRPLGGAASLPRPGLVVSLLWLVPTTIASGVGATWFATVRFLRDLRANSLPLNVLARILHFAASAPGVLPRSSVGRS